MDDPAPFESHDFTYETAGVKTITMRVEFAVLDDVFVRTPSG